jgi:hypothetical protein
VIDEEPYVAALARRLPVHEWPARPLKIAAVRAETGEPVTWDRTSSVPLGAGDRGGGPAGAPGSGADKSDLGELIRFTSTC